MREIIEERIDPNVPNYRELTSYMQELHDSEKQKCTVAFNNALNIGVSTYPHGDRLAEEIIFNHILSKIGFKTSLAPFTAFAEYSRRTREINICFSPYYIYYIAKAEVGELDEIRLTGYYRAVIKHELLHVMLKHLIADNTRHNAELNNLVMDALINIMIPEIPKLKFPSLTPEEVLEGKKGSALFIMASEYAIDRSFTWEQYYDYLIKKYPEQTKDLTSSYIEIKVSGNNQPDQSQSKGAGQNEKQDSESQNGGNQSKDDAGDEEKSGSSSGKEKDGKLIQDPAFNTQGDIRPVPASELPEDVVEQIEDIFKEVAERTRGLERFKMIGSLAIDTSKKISNNWRQALRKMFKDGSIVEKHYSMKRLDRRTDMPPAKKSTYRGGNVYILIDTSGSVSDVTLQNFASEVYGLLRKYKYKYKAFTFTVGVTSEIDIRKLRSGKLDIEDRGGTDVGEALKEILKNHTEPDVFIVLTDLYDDVPTPSDFANKQVIYALPKEHDVDNEALLKKYHYKYIVIE